MTEKSPTYPKPKVAYVIDSKNWIWHEFPFPLGGRWIQYIQDGLPSMGCMELNAKCDACHDKPAAMWVAGPTAHKTQPFHYVWSYCGQCPIPYH